MTRHLQSDVVGEAVQLLLSEVGYLAKDIEAEGLKWCNKCETAWHAFCDRMGGVFTAFPDVGIQPPHIQTMLGETCLAHYEKFPDRFDTKTSAPLNLKKLMPETVENFDPATGELKTVNVGATYDKYVKTESFREEKIKINDALSEEPTIEETTVEPTNEGETVESTGDVTETTPVVEETSTPEETPVVEEAKAPVQQPQSKFADNRSKFDRKHGNRDGITTRG